MRILSPRVLPLMFLLGACAPMEIYYRPGASVAKLSADNIDCEVKALAAAPVALERIQDPPQYVGPRKECDAAGNCVYEPGYWDPGHVFTVDVNRDLRQRVERQCMATRGYAPVSIPQCPAGITVQGRQQVLPKLSDKSCVIRDDDRFLIVERP